MKIKSVFSHAFEKYGKVLTGYDVTDLLKKLDETTKKPDNAVIYEPGDAGLEALPVAKEFSENAYGGMQHFTTDGACSVSTTQTKNEK
ncbi:MAG: DUF4867 family protein [Paludibacteraceae bacterium]|nr:DUF4867 family protein [Paludibacteraceae bacterium]